MNQTQLKLMRYSTPIPGPGCWLWEMFSRKGYGAVCINGRSTPAHRASYEAFVGPIPKGMLVCHKCDTPLCINPDHLFLGTVRDNALDMAAKGRGYRPSVRTHCINGHAYADGNYRVDLYQGYPRRICRPCNAAAVARYKARKESK